VAFERRLRDGAAPAIRTDRASKTEKKKSFSGGFETMDGSPLKFVTETHLAI
jgi:hypothetical protein